MADRASDAEKPGPTGCSAPVPRIGTLTLIGPPIWISPLASERQVPAFHIEAWFRVTPPSRRMPPGQQSGHPPSSSRVNEIPPVSTSSCTFRRVISGSLTLVFLTLTSRDQVPPFPQRSPPRLFTVAACGSLKPAPDGRLRGAYPHLLCGSALPLLVVRSRRTLVQVPAIAWPRATLTQPSRDRGAEFQYPAPHRFTRDVEPSFGQEFF